MKIAYYSDIHIEIHQNQPKIPWINIFPLNLGPSLLHLKNNIDCVLLAGDIGTVNHFCKSNKNINVLNYLEQLQIYLNVPILCSR